LHTCGSAVSCETGSLGGDRSRRLSWRELKFDLGHSWPNWSCQLALGSAPDEGAAWKASSGTRCAAQEPKRLSVQYLASTKYCPVIARPSSDGDRFVDHLLKQLGGLFGLVLVAEKKSHGRRPSLASQREPHAVMQTDCRSLHLTYLPFHNLFPLSSIRPKL